jgi:type III pantothenate kinase
MLLAIDVGNTDTKLGVFDEGPRGTDALLVHWRVMTERRRTADEFGALFIALFASANVPLAEVSAIAISSVVPQSDRWLREACARYFRRDPAFFTAAGQNLMEIRTERPRELGADLAASAIGARALHGAPLVVVGFGTATTFGAVAADGAYLGAAIAPGIQLSIDALAAGTAKLPQVALEAPPQAIGRDTVAALQSGIVYGFVGQTEALVARIRAELGAPARVVATGGLAEIVARHTTAIDAIEPHLVLEGLRLFHRNAVVAAEPGQGALTRSGLR